MPGHLALCWPDIELPLTLPLYFQQAVPDREQRQNTVPKRAIILHSGTWVEGGQECKVRGFVVQRVAVELKMVVSSAEWTGDTT